MKLKISNYPAFYLFISISLVAVFTCLIGLYAPFVKRTITKTQLKEQCNGSAKCESLYKLMRYEVIE
ncbi:K+-transporting ATPase c subunit [Pedobacter agri]|nr:K+-transporting ATPase c subunit [Pedobacter agri]